MGNGGSLTRFLPTRRPRFSREPGTEMFLRLRLSLTLWYAGVLAAALALLGVALYIGVQQVLFTSVQNNLAARVSEWQDQVEHDPGPVCSPPDSHHDHHQSSGPPSDTIIACYDQSGTLLGQGYDGSSGNAPQAFLANNLAMTALRTGQCASDIVNGGNGVGRIYRYALVVQDPWDGGTLVLQGGVFIAAQDEALHVLFIFLLAGGVLTLLVAGVGGLLLANRALAPARLAFARQQHFIADASHELRTPLTLLRADAEVLLRGKQRLAAEDAALLEDIVTEANHMANLANSMLLQARLDAGVQHGEQEVIEVDELIHAGVRRVKAFAEQKGISVQIEGNEPALVIGDPMLLEQALLIVLDNAIKYNQSGGKVIVRAAMRDEHVQVEVQDTGIGIPAEHLPHLGERFYRVDKARSREAGGTGLGLSIAHGIVASHQGKLTLSSTPNQGTTATIQLPLARGTASHAHSSDTARSLPPMQQMR